MKDKKEFYFLKNLYFRQKYYLIFCFLLLLLVTFINSSIPIIMQYLIDNIIIKGDFKLLLNFTLILVGFYLVFGILQFYANFINNKIMINSNLYLRDQILFKIMNCNVEDLISKKYKGDIVQTINNDIPVCQSILNHNIFQISIQLITFVYIFFVMIRLHLIITVILLFFFPLYFIIYKFFFKKIYKTSSDIYIARDQSSDITQKIIKNIFTFIMYRENTKFFDMYNNTNNDLYKQQNKFFLLKEFSNFSSLVIQILILFFVLLYGGNLVVNGTLTVGSFVALTMYISKFFSPLGNILQLFIQLKASFPSIHRVFSLLNIIDKNDGPINNINSPFNEIKILNLEKENIGSGKFSFEKGQLNFLLGKNGEGKTTLLLSIVKIFSSKNNSILINNININEINSDLIRSRISIVFQNPQFIGDNIIEQLAYSKKSRRKHNYLHLTNDEIEDISDICQTLLEGFNYNKNINDFSGGEKQLISIVTSLYSLPDVLILDESFSNLDLPTQNSVLMVLRKLKNLITIIIITHNNDIICPEDNIVLLNNSYNFQAIEV